MPLHKAFCSREAASAVCVEAGHLRHLHSFAYIVLVGTKAWMNPETLPAHTSHTAAGYTCMLAVFQIEAAHFVFLLLQDLAILGLPVVLNVLEMLDTLAR